MRFPHISKLEGVLYSLPCIAIYYVAFHLYNVHYLGVTPTLDAWSTKILIFGATMHMMYYLENGGQLTFGTQRIETYWRDGVCFVPNIFHFTLNWHFALIWGVKVKNDIRKNEESHKLDVLINPLLATTRHNVEMTPLQSMVDRGLTAILLWLFIGWKQGETHLMMMRVGFRLIVVAYVMATVQGSVGLVGEKISSTGNQVVNTLGGYVQQGTAALGLPEPRAVIRSTGRIEQLSMGKPPRIPSWEGFQPIRKNDMSYYGTFPGDDRKYYLYREPSPDYTDHVMVDESLCSIVSKGRKIFYWGTRPPLHASNMEDSVTYMRKKYGFTLFNWFEDVLLEKTTATWRYMYDHWGDVASTQFPILAKALDNWELPKDEGGEDSGGGLVCF